MGNLFYHDRNVYYMGDTHSKEEAQPVLDNQTAEYNLQI